MKLSFAVGISVLAILSFASAQNKATTKTTHKQGELSDAAYSARALGAAPKSVAKDAGVIRMDKDGKPRTLRESKNGFNCMLFTGFGMCNDANSMAFFKAMMEHQTPTDKVGVSYMLQGDAGASNTDPMATKKTADNHWVVTGPHIMVTGTAAKTLGYPETADADPTQPYMMWPGTPYEHAMIPISSGKAMAKTAAPETEKK